MSSATAMYKQTNYMEAVLMATTRLTDAQTKINVELTKAETADPTGCELSCSWHESLCP